MTPIEFYKLVDGANIYCYHNSDSRGPIEYEGDVYVPEAIERTEIESKGQVKRENIEVTFPLANAMALNFSVSTPENIVSLTVFVRSRVGTFVGWKGRMASVKPEGSGVKLIFESIFTSLTRTGVRQTYQRGCRHFLYGARCGVDKEAYKISAHAESMDGYTIDLSAAPAGEDGLYTGGIIEYNGSMRGIIEQDGNKISVHSLWPTIQEDIDASGGAGVDVFIYPGCDRTKEHCVGRYDNYLNFGGFPYIPTRNPFEGNIT